MGVIAGWQVGRFAAVRADRLAGDLVVRLDRFPFDPAFRLDSPFEILSWLPLCLAIVTLALCVGGWAFGGRRDRIADSASLCAWISLGATAGAIGAGHVPPDLPRRTAQLHLVQVDAIERRTNGIGWTGTLHASLDTGTWERYRVPIAVLGHGQPATGSYLMEGSCRPPMPRTSWAAPAPRLYLACDAMFALRDQPPSSSGLDRWMAAWEDRMARTRERIANSWQMAMGPESGTFAAWALLGVRPDDATRWLKPFIQTGTLHLLSISGLHLSLLGGAFWVASKIALRGWHGSRWVGLAALTLYAISVGLVACVKRALGMALIAAVGPSWGRSQRIWNGVGWVAALLPLFEPDLPGTVSFQLSLVATCGMILGGILATRVSKRFDEEWGESRLRSVTIALIGASFGATALTLPWSFHHFGDFYPLGILVNLIAIPVMGFVLPCLALAGVCVMLGADASFPWVAIARASGESFLDLLEILAHGSGWLSVRGHLPYEITLSSSVALGGIFWIASRSPRWTLWPALLFVESAFLAFPNPRLPLRVSFLEVGQGDAIVIELPGATWLFDAAPPDASPGRELVPTLLHRGVRRIDRLWLSHGDLDHWGQLTQLLESVIPVDTLVVASPSQFSDRFWTTLSSAPQRPTVIVTHAPWQRSLADSVRVRLHHPGEGVDDLERNDRSLVLELSVGRTNLLLVGDLEKEGEARLRERGGPPRALLAQAGHHGSSTSGSDPWYDEVEPVIAIASLGWDNKFEFPHQSLKDGLSKREITLLRTDLDGTVTVELGNGRVRLGRARPRLTAMADDP